MKWFLLVLVVFLLPFVTAQTNSITVLSVSSGNESIGGTATIFLEIRPGAGSVYIDSFPLTKLDTQISTRFAREYACSLAKMDCSRLDFFYVIRAPTSIIGGPSAGAAITVLTYATLEDMSLNDDTVMTGSINSGGIIGPVGGIPEKVAAAKMSGFTRVLIPQAEYNGTFPEGIEVITVHDVEDAIYYFTGENIRPEPAFPEPPAAYVAQMEEVSSALCRRAEGMAELIENVPNSSQEFLDKSVIALGEGKYYSAASFCFSAGLRLREEILNDYPQRNRRQIFRQLELDIAVLDESLPREFTSIADLEVFMIVRERLIDSNQRMSEEDFNNISASGLGYAIERYNSGLVWNSFMGIIPSQPLDLSERQLMMSCSQKLGEAEERINYLSYLVNAPLQDTRLELNNAYEDQRMKEYTLCLFKASKAKAEADSIISAVYAGSNLNDTVKRKIAKAEQLLGEQTAKGNFPILSYSYYEYAQDLDDLYTANLYAEYALELGNLEIYFPARSPRFHYDLTKIYLLIGGLLLGFGFGVMLTELYHHRKQKSQKKRKKK